MIFPVDNPSDCALVVNENILRTEILMGGNASEKSAVIFRNALEYETFKSLQSETSFVQVQLQSTDARRAEFVLNKPFEVFTY